TVQLRRTAFSSAPVGIKPSGAPIFLPTGYHPSVKYCRTSAAAAAACGVAQLVWVVAACPMAQLSAASGNADEIPPPPTAITSGLRLPSTVGPPTPDPWSLKMPAAATQIEFLAMPGDRLCFGTD